jgi:hypothetical protein
MSKGETQHKARKNHICEYCQDEIKKGDVYTMVRYKAPRYDENISKQLGIEYVTVRIHDTTECFEKVQENEN